MSWLIIGISFLLIAAITVIIKYIRYIRIIKSSSENGFKRINKFWDNNKEK